MMRIVKRAIAMVVAVFVLGTIFSEDLLPVVKAQAQPLTVKIDLDNEATAPQNWGLDYEFWNGTEKIGTASQQHIGISGSTIESSGYNSSSSIPTGATRIKIVSLVTADVLTAKCSGTELKVNDFIDIPNGSPFVITIRFEKKNQGGGQSGNNPPPIQNPKNILVSLNAPGGLCQGIRIDDRDVNPGTGTVQVEAGVTKRKIGICVEFGKAISKITINGSEINPIPPENQGWIILNDIDDANIYSIELEEGESDDISMVWAYDPATYGDDAVVENGQIELLSIKRNGDEIPFGDVVNEDGGYVQLKKGDDLVVKLIPDYGYQLKSASVNEQELEAQENVSTFELKNLQGNIHFSGIFVKTSDIATSNSEIATAPTILGGGNAANSGNISLSIDDNKNYAKDVTSAVSGNGIEQVASLDLSLDNIVSKGNGDNWVTKIKEFEKPISISVNVPESGLAAGETYSIVRDHNGVLTELDASYSDGKLVFKTNRFSTYTIVKKIANASSAPTSPKTGEVFPTHILMLFMVVGFGVVILFSKKRGKLV